VIPRAAPDLGKFSASLPEERNMWFRYVVPAALIAIRATKEPAGEDAGMSDTYAKSKARENGNTARSFSNPPRIARGIYTNIHNIEFIRMIRGD
jgi:hypothetical protein